MRDLEEICVDVHTFSRREKLTLPESECFAFGSVRRYPIRMRSSQQRRIETVRLAARLRAGMWMLCFIGTMMLFSHGPRRSSSTSSQDPQEWPDPPPAGTDALPNAPSLPSLDAECHSSLSGSSLSANITAAMDNSHMWEVGLTAPRVTFQVYAMSLCQHSAAFIRNLLPVLRRHVATMRVQLDFIGSGNSRFGFSSLYGSAGVVADAYILCQQYVTLEKEAFSEASNQNFLEFLSCVYEGGSDPNLPPLQSNGAPSFSRVEACVTARAGQLPDFNVCVRTLRASMLLEASYALSEAKGIKSAPTAATRYGWMPSDVLPENDEGVSPGAKDGGRSEGGNSLGGEEDSERESEGLTSNASHKMELLYCGGNSEPDIEASACDALTAFAAAVGPNVSPAALAAGAAFLRRGSECPAGDGSSGFGADGVCVYTMSNSVILAMYYSLPLLVVMVILCFGTTHALRSYGRISQRDNSLVGDVGSDADDADGAVRRNHRLSIQLQALNHALSLMPGALEEIVSDPIGRRNPLGLTTKDIAGLPTSVLTTESACVAENAMCGICMDDLAAGDLVYDISCSHKFHMKCLGDWLKQKNECPNCRQAVFALADEVAEAESEPLASGAGAGEDMPIEV